MINHGGVGAEFYYNVKLYMWKAIPIEYLSMFFELCIGKCP
jgi:hypothetical protein